MQFGIFHPSGHPKLKTGRPRAGSPGPGPAAGHHRKGRGHLKKLVMKITSWMERNLEEPLVKAEMARAAPARKKNGAATVVHLFVAAGLVVMICWLFFSAIR